MGEPAERQCLAVAVLDVVGHVIGEDVVDEQVVDVESVLLEQASRRPARIGVGDRTARLRLRVPRDHFIEPPEHPVRLPTHDRQHLPRPSGVHRQLQCRLRSCEVRADLLQDTRRVRRVMDDAKRVDEVIRPRRQALRQPFGVSFHERDAVSEPEYLSALARQIQ